MFEKLAGNVLSKVLSKYFTEESLSKNKVFKSAQLGVWSGYVTLHDLEVKVDVINKKLRQKGQPVELIHCTLRQVEITIPWAKLSNPISGISGSTSSGSNNDDNSSNGASSSTSGQDAVAVLVMDGVHVLFRTSFNFHDEELKEEEVKQRRKALSVSEGYAKSSKSDVDEYYEQDRLDDTTGKTYTEMLKKRITSGLLQEIFNKLHIHIRDLHIRIEDKESDPMNPFAFGVTMESMHLQHDDEDDDEAGRSSSSVGVVSKVAQMNHFAAYWNSLEYGHGLPVEHSVLHETCKGDKEKMCRALDRCIARRGSLIASPSKKVYIPKHTYLLLPVDGYLHALLSTSPKDLTARPAVDIAIQLDSVSTNLRDFQCVQMLKLHGKRKNFLFAKKYRKYRPNVPVMQDAKAWWAYAARVIRSELKGSLLRWSWSRFQKSYETRARYMHLYERRIRNINDGSTTASGESLNPDADILKPLSIEEVIELLELEDGVRGDLTVSEIILYRGLANIRIGDASKNAVTNGGSSVPTKSRSSWWTQTVQDATAGDSEARDEFDRLLQYLDRIPDEKLVPESKNDSLTAVSVVIQLEEVHFAMFAPLQITSDETQLKRLHEKFLDFNSKVTRIGGSLKGDYKKFDFEFSVMDFVVSEVWMDKSHHVVANQLQKEGITADTSRDQVEGDEEKTPLFLFTYSKNPVNNPEVNKEIRMFLNPIEIILNPECQWLAHFKQFLKEITTVPNVSKYWRELSLAHLNSLTIGKLGLVAKAESAASHHENVDIDLNLHCPVFRVGMGNDGDLVIDLGFLSLKTDKLAGISRNKFKNLPLLQDEEAVKVDIVQTKKLQKGIEDGSLSGSISIKTRSTRKKPFQRFFVSSGMSVGSINMVDRGNQSFSGSFTLDDNFPQLEAKEERKGSQEEAKLEELFYDKYQMCLRTGKIIFSGESEVFDISTGFEIRSVIQKSVIPTDHTLCKIKLQAALGRVKLVLNENLLSRFGMAMKTWKSLLQADTSSQSYNGVTNTRLSFRQVGDLLPVLAPTLQEDESFEVESASVVDENEFFDANEGHDSVGGENSGVWFEEHWIADAESVIDGESRSSLSDRRGRRRPPSVSDMSSVSDQSAGRRRNQQDNGYLNAENLARLEEGVGDEDDSVAESRNENDNDSFYSVISAGGQEKLLLDLKDDIQKSEAKIKDLQLSLEGLPSTPSDSEPGERKKKRREVKLQLDRAKAELRALNALSTDLATLLTEQPDGDVKDTDEESLAATRVQQARSAKALLRAKKRRDAAGYDMTHSLVRNLNRELFKGSILINKIQIILQIGEAANGDKKDDNTVSEFDFLADQAGLAFFYHANESKAYFSLDQVTAKVVSSNDDSSDVLSSVLFSGGSNDTLLPGHLPHLVAHSMEDRFIRGAINIGKHRSSEASRQLATVMKLRVVVGDIEISPYRRCLRPILDCVRRLKTSIESLSPTVETDTMPTEIQTKAPTSQTAAQVYDLAVRLASVRLVLSHQDHVVGAAAMSETSVRFLQMASKLRERTQLDFRCANAQILDVVNLEAGRGSEIFGRRDPYSSLFQLRLRSQIVPKSERGGWVIDGERGESISKEISRKDAVRNIHVGLRLNPMTIVASSDAFSKFNNSSGELRKIVSTGKANGVKSRSHEKVSFMDKLSEEIPLRWRFDFSMRRININFPEKDENEWGLSDDLGSKMLMALTIIVSVQESSVSKGSVSLRVGVMDISMIRSSDDWPILQPFSIALELVSRHDALSCLRTGLPDSVLSLVVRQDSSLNEIEAIMARLGWDSMPARKTDDTPSRLTLKVSPFKSNISASVIGVLADISKSMKRDRPITSRQEESQSRTPRSFLPTTKGIEGAKQFSLQVSIDDMEIQLLREAESKPIALANPLISFTLTDVAVDYSQGEQVQASILIRDSALFDLSSGKAIRVVGEDPEARLGFPYFVRVKLYMHYGPQTIRLHINWGRIQCLVLPSFVRSLLELKEGLKSIRGSTVQSSNPSTSKADLFGRFLHHPNDVNLMISADAETFECILASKDIVDYVRKGDRDPIGVVTFRWKASLSLALALDCLRSSSMPWLTLNLDGAFTDEDDVNLFKDFSNRYLVHEFPDSNENSVNKLANAFTVRVSHRLSSFQALRTNISRMDLYNSPRKGIVSMPRICFKISQPTAGEQRITNPIDFTLLYRVAGASATKISEPYPSNHVEFAQLLDMRANFVDVLLYIQSKSSGGFTDAYRVSIKPILEMLKRKDNRRIAEEIDSDDLASGGQTQHQTPKFLDLVKGSPSICVLRIEGFQVTCVPGGASRLNESPIIKFELTNAVLGVGAAPVKCSLKMIHGSGTTKPPSSPNRHYISGSEAMNMMSGGWVACQVTGHYHNRRLVAWEPFIEPWAAHARFGIDLVEVLNWRPVVRQDLKLSSVPTENGASALDSPETASTGTGKDRLRDIGRLFRSPFQQSVQASSSPRKGSTFISHLDFCYLMLASSARRTIISALYPSSDLQSGYRIHIILYAPFSKSN